MNYILGYFTALFIVYSIIDIFVNSEIMSEDFSK